MWNADEQAEVRGTDQGPNPYELLLGSLGACTALTLRFYAHHKGLALETVRIEYEFTREYARDCRECEEDGDARLDVIRADVTMSLQVLSYQDLGITSVGGAISLVHHVAVEVMGKIGEVTGAAATASFSIETGF